MRNIIYAQLVSADGYIEDRNGKIDWTKPSEELHRHFNELEKRLDINFYGRKPNDTSFLRHWPRWKGKPACCAKSIPVK